MLGMNSSFKMSNSKPIDYRLIRLSVTNGRGSNTVNDSYLPKPYNTLIPCKVDPKPEEQTPSVNIQVVVDEII